MTKDFIIIQAETFRILRSEDSRNWILQVWKEGGINPKTGEKGKGHGQMEVPEGTLQGQLKGLMTELKRVEKSIVGQLEKAIHVDLV